ncbi:phosphoglycerate dehydrogenase [Glycomyces buryatensis]|uniref:Phosphoglycerate dehydrogenase n=1 Tax=Glycomyces buryatensis TaxID=2570927 RepID=A0A4S8PTJ5_9ACTN|nr:phosphoglycerate dehydrogenase [Glycomyces buryatensis]THV34678.1 phosphoglycerate dehydrogenase [Glycomyces buryatensis]
MTARVLITTAYLEPGGEVDRLLADAGCETVFRRAADRKARGERLVDVVGEVDAIVAGTDSFDADVIDAAHRLTVIGRCGVGYDNIDVEAATRQGVAVTFTPGVNRSSVAELVIGQLVNGARLLPQNIAAIRAGAWDQPSGTELGGSVLGIAGLGSIGKAVAVIARAMGMTVMAFDPHFDSSFAARHGIEEATLDQVLAASDFLTLHMALDETTRNLIDTPRIAAMKPGAFLVNTARGGIVDESALAVAIREGRLSGAALDVLEEEPLAADSPLRGLDRVLITAHIGAATHQARARSSLMAARQVIDHLGGNAEPDNLVNPAYRTAATGVES